MPSPTTTGDRIWIPVKAFLMFALVLVGETYDCRNDCQLSCACPYIIGVTGRVVVGKTYDHRDDALFSLEFRKHFEVAAPG